MTDYEGRVDRMSGTPAQRGRPTRFEANLEVQATYGALPDCGTCPLNALNSPDGYLISPTERAGCTGIGRRKNNIPTADLSVATTGSGGFTDGPAQVAKCG